MKNLLFFLLFFNLSHCFLIPRIKIKRAFYKKNCQSLSKKFIYDLSLKELETSVRICLEKENYQQGIVLLNSIEEKLTSLSDQLKIKDRRADIYFKNLNKYSLAIWEFEKILEKQPKNFKVKADLIKALIKNQSLKRALKEVQDLLSQKLKPDLKLEMQFIQGRLFLLLQKKKQALKVFRDIKRKNIRFFNKNKGSFYLALLLEEDKKFLEAIQELKKTNWSFSKSKLLHWRNRNENMPKGKL